MENDYNKKISNSMNLALFNIQNLKCVIGSLRNSGTSCATIGQQPVAQTYHSWRSGSDAAPAAATKNHEKDGARAPFPLEYSLSDINKPMGVSEYQLTQCLPENLRSILPSVAAIEAELSNRTHHD